MGGPIYHRSDFENPECPFPTYYERKWFITDWTRGWIMVVTLDESGAFKSMEQFLPELDLTGPIDMDFGPDGTYICWNMIQGDNRNQNRFPNR